MPKCKYMDGITCNFEHELVREDCILCMPNAMLLHLGILLDAVKSMTGQFGYAKIIYAAFNEIEEMQRGLVKLMKKEFPEVVERAKIPKRAPSRVGVA